MTVVAEFFATGPFEAVVWLDCPHERLQELARVLNGGDPPVPEPDRHLLALTFGPEHESLIPPEILEQYGEDEHGWGRAYLTGVTLAAVAAARAHDAGIPVKVYAVRVQPVGADFPSSYQWAAAPPQGDLPAGERG